jgi:hypothetical protein
MKTDFELERDRQLANHIRWARDCISVNERGSRKLAADLSRHPSPEGMRAYAMKMREAANAADKYADAWDAFLALADDGEAT